MKGYRWYRKKKEFDISSVDINLQILNIKIKTLEKKVNKQNTKKRNKNISEGVFFLIPFSYNVTGEKTQYFLVQHFENTTWKQSEKKREATKKKRSSRNLFIKNIHLGIIMSQTWVTCM